LLSFSSCGKVPQAKFDATNAAIAAAQTAEAAVYVPAEFTAVQDSMKLLMLQLKFRNQNYSRNLVYWTQIGRNFSSGTKVSTDAVAKKEEVKKDVETTIAAVKAIQEENAALLKKAPRGKEGAAVLEGIKTDIAAIDASIVEHRFVW